MWKGNLFLVDAIHRGRESRAKKKRLRTKKNRILRTKNNKVIASRALVSHYFLFKFIFQIM